MGNQTGSFGAPTECGQESIDWQSGGGSIRLSVRACRQVSCLRWTQSFSNGLLLHNSFLQPKLWRPCSMGMTETAVFSSGPAFENTIPFPRFFHLSPTAQELRLVSQLYHATYKSRITKHETQGLCVHYTHDPPPSCKPSRSTGQECFGIVWCISHLAYSTHHSHTGHLSIHRRCFDWELTHDSSPIHHKTT